MSEEISGAPPKCGHGITLATLECAECTGPLNEAELDVIRRRVTSHAQCGPWCPDSPSGEASRMLVTIFRLRAEVEALKEAVAEEDVRIAKIRAAANAERDAQERELSDLRTILKHHRFPTE